MHVDAGFFLAFGQEKPAFFARKQELSFGKQFTATHIKQ